MNEQPGTFPAPYTVNVPGSLEVRPDTASAVFDGTGAGGSFLACLTFISPEGSRLCRMFNPTPVNAGDVAEVTFIPPFGSAASGSGGTGTNLTTTNTGGTVTVDPTTELLIGSGITLTNPSGGTAELVASGGGSGLAFDTDPQSGDWLVVSTTGSGGSGFGIDFTASEGMRLNGGDPADNPALFIFQEAAANNEGFSSLSVSVDDGGFSACDPTAIEGDASVNSAGSSAQAIIGSAVGHGSWTAAGALRRGLVGVDAEASASLGSTGDVVGAYVLGGQRGTGREIGLAAQVVGFQTGANSLPILVSDSSGNPIFEVRDDGSVHIPTGTSVIADL